MTVSNNITVMHPTDPPRRQPPPTSGGRARLALLFGACLLGTVSCGPDEPVALRVGEVTFTERKVLGLTEERKALLGEITAVGLAISEGRLPALADPLVARAERDYLARVVLADRVLDSADVAEAVLRARYETSPELELTVRHLILMSPRYEPDEARADARRKAEEALRRIRGGGAPFPDVAAEVSEEPGAEGREGLLEPGRRGAWVDEFWAAASALDPGEISGVVETQYGYHVLRLEAKDTVPFEEVRDRIALDVAAMLGAGSTPSALPLPAGFEVVDDPSSDSARVVARWTGGSLTLDEFRNDLATLPVREWTATLSDPGARRTELEEAVRLRAAAARAREEGHEVPETVEAAVRTEWSETSTRWSANLGFTAGMDPTAIAAAARAALDSMGQATTLAVREVHERSPLVRREYRIETPSADARPEGTRDQEGKP